MSLDKTMKFRDLKDMLQQSGEKYGERPAFILQEENGNRIITHKQFRNEINYLGTALVEMGLKGKRIALISENRYEWEVAYLAIATGVGIVVPLDKALPENEIESLIQRSEVEAIFYSRKYDEEMANDIIKNTKKEQKNFEGGKKLWQKKLNYQKKIVCLLLGVISSFKVLGTMNVCKMVVGVIQLSQQSKNYIQIRKIK